MIFLNSASSDAALVCDLPVCVHNGRSNTSAEREGEKKGEKECVCAKACESLPPLSSLTWNQLGMASALRMPKGISSTSTVSGWNMQLYICICICIYVCISSHVVHVYLSIFHLSIYLSKKLANKVSLSYLYF